MDQAGWRSETDRIVHKVPRAGVVEFNARKAGRHRRHRVKFLSEHLILTPIRDRSEIVPAPKSYHEGCNRRPNLPER